jgi:hypothetical protein
MSRRGGLEKEKYSELYRRFREQYLLPAQLIQQAMNQGVETGKSFLELKRDGRVYKPRPEVGRVSMRFAKGSWSYKKAISSVAPVRLGLSLPGGRREVWIKPHRRFWLYWWKMLRREVELASTLVLKRRRDWWLAIFVFDVVPKREPPAEAVAFDVNENSVAVARLSLLATVDAVAQWNRQYLNPAVYSVKTDFGRLAKRYEAVRNAKLEELKRKYPYAGPIHFAPLRDNGGWHALYCPYGHVVDRDVAAVLNMLWKVTQGGTAKGVWWDLKDVKGRLEKGRGLVPKEAARRRNSLITWPIVRAVWASLKAQKASSQWPAVLARAAPMNSPRRR